MNRKNRTIALVIRLAILAISIYAVTRLAVVSDFSVDFGWVGGFVTAGLCLALSIGGSYIAGFIGLPRLSNFALRSIGELLAGHLYVLAAFGIAVYLFAATVTSPFGGWLIVAAVGAAGCFSRILVYYLGLDDQA